MLSRVAKQKLVMLADSLDKKGFKKEADMVDRIIRKAGQEFGLNYTDPNSGETWNFSCEGEGEGDHQGVYDITFMQSNESDVEFYGKRVPIEIEEFFPKGTFTFKGKTYPQRWVDHGGSGIDFWSTNSKEEYDSVVEKLKAAGAVPGEILPV